MRVFLCDLVLAGIVGSGFGVRGWEMSLGSVRRRLEWVWGVGVEVDSMVACARDVLCM
jgi:hypothetical protein